MCPVGALRSRLSAPTWDGWPVLRQCVLALAVLDTLDSDAAVNAVE
jgi:hypothetical protein